MGRLVRGCYRYLNGGHESWTQGMKEMEKSIWVWRCLGDKNETGLGGDLNVPSGSLLSSFGSVKKTEPKISRWIIKVPLPYPCYNLVFCFVLFCLCHTLFPHNATKYRTRDAASLGCREALGIWKWYLDIKGAGLLLQHSYISEVNVGFYHPSTNQGNAMCWRPDPHPEPDVCLRAHSPRESSFLCWLEDCLPLPLEKVQQMLSYNVQLLQGMSSFLWLICCIFSGTYVRWVSKDDKNPAERR